MSERREMSEKEKQYWQSDQAQIDIQKYLNNGGCKLAQFIKPETTKCNNK